MAYAFWHNEPLAWREIYNAIFKIDEEISIEDKEGNSVEEKCPK